MEVQGIQNIEEKPEFLGEGEGVNEKSGQFLEILREY